MDSHFGSNVGAEKTEPWGQQQITAESRGHIPLHNIRFHCIQNGSSFFGLGLNLKIVVEYIDAVHGVIPGFQSQEYKQFFPGSQFSDLRPVVSQQLLGDFEFSAGKQQIFTSRKG